MQNMYLKYMAQVLNMRLVLVMQHLVYQMMLLT